MWNLLVVEVCPTNWIVTQGKKGRAAAGNQDKGEARTSGKRQCSAGSAMQLVRGRFHSPGKKQKNTPK
jgi:hypothetical protein